MSVIFDTYIPGDSFLHKMDPRVKILGTLMSFVMVFWLPGIVPQLLLLTSFHLVLLCAGVRPHRLLTLWRQMGMLLMLIMLIQPLFQPSGYELFALGPIRLTLGGLTDAGRLAARAMGFALAVAVMLYTTDHHTLVLAFVKLGIPYTWGLTISLALRFLPAIQSLFHTIRDAQASRGWVASGNVFKRFREYFPVLIAVIVGTLRMSDQLTLALAARGLDTTEQRTRWHDLHMRSVDWMWFLVLLLMGATFIWWRLQAVLP